MYQQDSFCPALSIRAHSLDPIVARLRPHGLQKTYLIIHHRRCLHSPLVWSLYWNSSQFAN